MVDSTFRETLGFLDKLGVFDVILPFLLVFSITYAILEKTRVFGTEVVDGKTYTKKNLNSLTSFAISFFTIASAQVVHAITQISANAVILLFASVLFLMLVGSFHQQTDEKGFALEGKFKTLFIIVMFVGLFGIFLNAIESDGKSWLRWIFDWLSQFSSNISVATVVLIGLVIAAMVYITGGKGESSKSAEKH